MIWVHLNFECNETAYFTTFFGNFLFIFATKPFFFPRLLDVLVHDHKLIKLNLLLYQKQEMKVAIFKYWVLKVLGNRQYC